MARQYKLMSADGHLEVPPERWIHRVPEKYRDRAPRTVHLPDGGDALMIEGQPLLEANFLDLRAGRAEGTWQPFGLKVADAAGTGSPEQRVREQDEDGMDAEVLFAAMVAGPVFWRNIAHDEVYKAVIRGYNDWLAEEYCAVAPDRLIGMGVMPITNVDDAIAEMQHCKKLGLKGVLLGGLPNGKGYPTPEDDRFWAAALDLDMPAAVGMTQLVLAGVFERFPKLQILFAETRLGWVPFWLEHMDLWYARHLGWAEEYLGFKPLKHPPGDYIRQNIHFTVQYERAAVEQRHYVGSDHIMFATDFPHIENEWPNSRPIIDEIYANVPPAEKHQIWAGNAARFFHLES